MPALFKNNATATLAVSINSSTTTIVLNSGLGALFPTPTGSSYFLATIYDSLGNYEIVKCTARVTDTLTVVRGQEGTAPQNFAIGDGVAQRLTAGNLNNFVQLDGNSILSGINDFTGTITVPTVATVDSSTKAASTAYTNAAITAAIAAIPPTSGRIIQAITNQYTSTVSTTSSSFVSTGHQATITPTSVSSKILVLQSGTLAQTQDNAPVANSMISIFRNGTNLAGGTGIMGNVNVGYYGSIYASSSISLLDAPASTSALTYAVYYRNTNSNALYNFGFPNSIANLILLEIL
jgi:hypothetical protein